MAYQSVDLTLVDQEILNSYSNMIEGLACYLGEGYEIVLHSLENYEHSVINIINGSHTGRKIGAPITDLALNMLEKIENTDKDYITYFSTNKKGEPAEIDDDCDSRRKSAESPPVCMNLYMNTSLNDFVKTLVPADAGLLGQPAMENFADNSDELIESTLRSIRERVMNDASIAPSNKNKMIVMGLDDYGIFNIKDAVIKVANLLDISKNTVYMHLRNKQNNK